LIIATNSVIISSGGIGSNKDMLERFFPGHGEAKTMGAPSISGDGIQMAQEVNALIEAPITGFAPRYNGSLTVKTGELGKNMPVFLLSGFPQLIAINKNGERCMGSPSYKSLGNLLALQPDKVMYSLLDSALLKDIIRKRAILGRNDKEKGDNGAWYDQLEEALKVDAAKGILKIADTWDEMAAFIGAKPEVLKATIEQYNSYCDQGYDPDFLRDKNYLIPLHIPPYYALPQSESFHNTMGGIVVNRRMEVLNKKGNPIGGLYATGDVAGHCIAIAYKYSGLGNTFALYSGEIAGDNAAAYVKSLANAEL